MEAVPNSQQWHQRHQVALAIYRLRKEWSDKGYSHFAINTGNCDAFAQALLDLFPYGSTYWGEEIPEFFPSCICSHGHCFFSLNGYFYDSEAPHGVPSPAKLPFYRRSKSVSRTTTCVIRDPNDPSCSKCKRKP